jgi:hypothetical protein
MTSRLQVATNHPEKKFLKISGESEKESGKS